MSDSYKKIAFLGLAGSNSHMACQLAHPALEAVSCAGFEDVFTAVREGRADLAMIPVDNNLAGRVADVHQLLPKAGLFVVGEYFLPIRFALLAPRGAQPAGLKKVYSHAHAFPQCRAVIKKYGLEPQIFSDTAAAARHVRDLNDPSCCALAAPIAAQIYDLETLAADVQDSASNMTRFLILARRAAVPPAGTAVLTSLIFRVRNIPAALYKALGGFATNGLNLAKLESYVDEQFQAAQFYCEVQGHPQDRLFDLALRELRFYTEDVQVLGTYPVDPAREKLAAK